MLSFMGGDRGGGGGGVLTAAEGFPLAWWVMYSGLQHAPNKLCFSLKHMDVCL